MQDFSDRKNIAAALTSIFDGISHLHNSFPIRQFTIDGRLVGDIGEIIAALMYDIELDELSQPDHDGTTSDGKRVQVKATFQDALTFKTVPQYYLGLKLFQDGHYEEIYNGPGEIIRDKYSHRSGIGVNLLRFPNTDLKKLSNQVPRDQKVPSRT